MKMEKMPGWGSSAYEKDCFQICDCGCGRCSNPDCQDNTCSGNPSEVTE